MKHKWFFLPVIFENLLKGNAIFVALKQTFLFSSCAATVLG